MIKNNWFEKLQADVSDLIAKSPVADIERNLKALMNQAFSRLDLVTREDFEVQQELLARTRERLETLEKRIQELEDSCQNA